MAGWRGIPRRDPRTTTMSSRISFFEGKWKIGTDPWH
ncbi:hypothetical protein GDO86_007729 [Hymenochirus boettgeri]|uniref:Uncharacterized protein n=1 Tax=Hymenochirus boettgeri TaxID=247094 RepID=A0A8T2J263_9PIPI|nr:hypothetical protein GDO86_007729 [Hymenochirus boettgeri]